MSQTQALAVRVTGLKTEAINEALGIDEAAPRFTWRIETTRQAVQQRSFRVIVATSEQAALQGRGAGMIWDSGSITSADPFAIYRGPALQSRTRYFWNVRVNLRDGAATLASPVTWFETAYLKPTEWHGDWITVSGRVPASVNSEFCRPTGMRRNTLPCREVRPAPMLRQSFSVAPVSLHGNVVSARIYSAGLAYNNMTLNGVRTSERVLDPGFTNYARTVLYTTDDATKLIRQDPAQPTENVIATQLGTGQFDDETTSGDWGWETAEWRAAPQLRLDLYVRYKDGTEQLVKSDGSWKANVTGPTRYDGYYLGETYDARKEIAGWNVAGSDVALWTNARVVGGPKGVMRAAKQESTKIVASWPAGTRTSPLPGVVVYDTGMQRAGWATIAVSGAPAGTEIQIFYSDKTADDGTVSSTGYTPNGQIQTDYYIANGTGTVEKPELFAPQFTYKGFQYIQISAPSNPASTSGGKPQPLPQGVDVRVVSVQEVRTPMQPTGSFKSSNTLLNQIEKSVRTAVAENYVAGIITDTPEYEKNGWTGDAQLSAPAASLLFNTERQYRKSLQDMVDNAVPDTGELVLLAPTNKGYGHVGQTFKNANNAGATPVWDAFWFVIPWESYMRYGDVRVLETAYPMMQKYLDNWIPKWTAKDGDNYEFTLTSGLGDWDPPTGADAGGTGPTGARIPTVIAPTSTAYYAYLARIAGDTARALGKTADAAHFDSVVANIRRDFNAKWWDSTVGFYREDANQPFVQTMNALALTFDLVPQDRRAALEAKLIDDVMNRRAGHEEVGIAGARWILPTLSRAGHDGVNAAYTVAIQKTYPSYGYWIGLGWTSLGEYWEKSSRTRSHHMFGGVAQWMYEDLVGIRPVAPGYQTIAFDPTIPDALEHAEAQYESVRGKISASWRKEGAKLVLEVEVPATSNGLVYLPAKDQSEVKTDGQVEFVRKEGSRLVYRVNSGKYLFAVER